MTLSSAPTQSWLTLGQLLCSLCFTPKYDSDVQLEGGCKAAAGRSDTEKDVTDFKMGSSMVSAFQALVSTLVTKLLIFWVCSSPKCALQASPKSRKR